MMARDAAEKSGPVTGPMVVRCRVEGFDRAAFHETPVVAACQMAIIDSFLSGGFVQMTSLQESFLDPTAVRVTLMVATEGGAPAVRAKLHNQRVEGFLVEVCCVLHVH